MVAMQNLQNTEQKYQRRKKGGAFRQNSVQKYPTRYKVGKNHLNISQRWLPQTENRP